MKPILFNTEMTRAILAGRKTVTRRVVKFKPGQNPHWSGYEPDGPVLYGSNNIPAVKSPYRPGDVLYVRETWARVSDWTAVDESVGQPDGYIYRADWPDGEHPVWRPSIHMPREAARIFLRVTDVRVERLRDITGCQILAEGVDNGYANPTMGAHWENAQRMAFADVWDSTIKPTDLDKYGWAANPWVWAIAFERISREEAENG